MADVKPLVAIAGRPLILHVLGALADAGMERAVVVVGREATTMRAALARAPLPVETVFNPDWERAPNGVSVLAAAPLLRGRALLCMADHLVEPALYARVASAGVAPGEAMLGIDRRLGHPAVDEADVTKVRTQGDRIAAIGKALLVYDAYDTGVFDIDEGLLDALQALPRPSLTDGMTALAARGTARAVDIGAGRWLDVDDPRALALAEGFVAAEPEPLRPAA